jgi:3-hydroxyisobutyrate dehydrogenase-like beta-hydroxyacid dehydrogenase
VNHVPAIGFVGFGEAGSTIARGLRSAGVEDIVAFDINAHHPDLGPRIRQRAADTGTRLVGANAELARSSEIIFSTVTSSSALDATGRRRRFSRRGTYTPISTRYRRL